MSGYDSSRRSARSHRRVVRKGSERFDVEGIRSESSDRVTAAEKQSDDDKRILGELPPHWGIFSERDD